jgi:hypothetical protein
MKRAFQAHLGVFTYYETEKKVPNVDVNFIDG